MKVNKSINQALYKNSRPNSISSQKSKNSNRKNSPTPNKNIIRTNSVPKKSQNVNIIL